MLGEKKQTNIYSEQGFSAFSCKSFSLTLQLSTSISLIYLFYFEVIKLARKNCIIAKVQWQTCAFHDSNLYFLFISAMCRVDL